MQSSIVSFVIEKDLLHESRIKNPALLKQTFQILQALPAIEISYTKLLGQLQDKGNTDLVKNYLDLFEGAFLIKQIHKYNKKTFKKRLSTAIPGMSDRLVRQKFRRGTGQGLPTEKRKNKAEKCFHEVSLSWFLKNRNCGD